jgi:translocation and assembly module TamB
LTNGFLTKRGVRITASIIGAVIALPLLGILFIIAFANTGAGRATIERLAAKFSGGTVQIQGFGGTFPGALRLAHAEIRDKDGAWLTLDDVALDWSPLALLGGQAKIDRLTAAHIAVARLPVSDNSASSKSKSSPPPLRIALDTLRVDKLDLGAELAHAPASVSVNGHLRFTSLTDGDVALDIERLDGPGSYKLTGKTSDDGDNVALNISEPSHGLLAELSGLSDLGAVSVAATLVGPRNAEQLGLAMKAGDLTGNGKGTIDIKGQSVDLDLTVAAPAMAPRPDLHWQSANLDLHVHGPFTGPDAAGKLAIADLAAGGASIGSIAADLQGNRGKIDLNGVLERVHVPGPQPDLFAAAPIALQAEAILDQPTRPLTFTITHPLIGVTGEAQLGGAMSAIATTSLPNLAPFAALGGVTVEGHGAVVAKMAQQGETMQLSLDGTLDVTGGEPMATTLIGETATLAVAGSMTGSDFTLDRATIDGKGLHVSAHGNSTGGAVDLAWGATLANLGALAPTLSGPLSVEGRLHGPQDNLALNMESHGQIAVPGVPSGPVDATIDATGLPAHPSGQIDVRGQLAGALITVSSKIQRGDDGGTQVTLSRAQWKSLNAQGDLTLPPGAVFPLGRMRLRATRLADLSPLIGMQLAGSIDATLDTVDAGGKPQAKLRAEARQLAAMGDSAERATLDATITDPASHPVTASQIVLTGITAANGITGSTKIEANGPQEALALRLTSDLNTAQGPAHITSAATANLPERVLQLAALQADYRGETIKLLGPAKLRLADGIAIDQLRLGSGSTTLTIAGQISPKLEATVALRNATPALATPFFPDLNGAGTLSADAKLSGTLAAPAGTIRATGRGLRITNGAGGALPPADLDANATLRGDSAQIDVRLASGSNLRLQLTGTAPLKPNAPMNLRSTGNVNLVLLDPWLTAEGRSLRGQVTLDIAVTGTMASPRASGSARIANGSVQDFVQGIHITAISGSIAADGDTLRLTQFSGKAGEGTIAIAGTVGVAAPMPIDLTITANNAKPLASDLLNATMDANLTVKGEVAGDLAVGGRIHVDDANIQIPDKFPQSVAVLDVRRPGQKSPPPAPPSTPIAIDLTIDAPQRVFVRGHGLDAEMGGRLHLAGSSAALQISGGFDLRHGNFSLAGQTLNFTSGRVAFDGYGLQSKLDPTLDFVAQSTANGVTATLNITGYADQPKIRLSSSPDLPQDEILAQLLFGQSVKQLTPFQVVQIAQALAAVTGIGGGGDPLASIRKGLGLDRLSVGAASGNGPGATVEAGKYVANGVYVGTKQGTSGGTQAQVQIDLTKHLKLETQLGTGGTPATGSAVTPDNDPGSSIGLTYQFEY